MEGREFVYVETPPGEGFSPLTRDVFASCPDVPLPESGAVLEMKARLILPDKTSLLAMSYKGDLLGWRRKIAAYCEEKRRIWGILENQTLVLSDGSQVSLGVCQVVFEE